MPDNNTCEVRGGRCLMIAAAPYGGHCPGGDNYEVFPTAGTCTVHASPNVGCCLPFEEDGGPSDAGDGGG